MRLAVAAIAAALAVPAVPAAASRPEPKAAPDPCAAAPLACGDAVLAADGLERAIVDNFWHGHVVDAHYRTAERVPGDVVDASNWGDSGLWTGVYLGGQAMRYAVARDKLRGGKPKLSDEERAYWTAQQAEAYARVRRMVDQYHLLVNIARGWRTETALNPTGNPPSFGGGVFQGEEGLLMRACAPAPSGSEPIGIRPRANKRVFGPFRWEDGRDYYCETAPSRDTYAGTTFGLLLAFDLVSVDDKRMRDQIRSDVLLLAGRLVKYGWSFPRPHGNVSHPGPQPLPGGGGHDFDNFWSPYFMQQVPLARLNIAQVARHVADSGGSDQERATWNAVWAEELATQLPVLGLSMQVDAVEPNASYYKYNLHHLTAYTTIRLERDAAVRQELKRAIAVMDTTTRDDVNAHFEAITYALTGDADRRDDAVRHLAEWLDYRARSHAGALNSERCGTDIECVPQDQLDVVVAGETVRAFPGTRGLRARTPLPVAVRPPTDFLWQRPPTQLDGTEGATVRTPGVDYLTPYWMLRYHTEVERPARAPFPAWAGPAHR